MTVINTKIMRKTLLVLTLSIIFAVLPRSSTAQPNNRLVHEGLVNAPLNQVWAAFTTKEGLETWMAPHVAVELKIAGKLKTQYDPKGSVDDATAIENTILSYEPLRMLSIKATKAPDGFPFPNAIKNMWTVIYFTPAGQKKTRIRVVSMGFGSDDESRKMREFFDRGNAFTLKQLQQRFAHKVAK